MISVVLPTYNREKTILSSIESVLSQSFKDIELIVVDDGSTDRTRELVESIDDSRIEYVYQNNAGACVARNTGIKLSKGDYIAFQDSDDFWYPEKLAKQIEAFHNQQNVAIVTCRTMCRRLDGRNVTSLLNRSGGVLQKEEGPYGITTQTLLVKKEVFDYYLFDPNVPRYQDLDFLLCASKRFQIYLVPEVLVQRKIEDDSISNHPEKILEAVECFQRKHSDILNDKKQFLSYFLSSMLIQNANQVTKEEKVKFYKKSIEINKSIKIIMKIVYHYLKGLVGKSV